MNKKMKITEIILIGIIIVATTISVNQIYQDNLKINFLQDALDTKTLHYEWLSKIIDYLTYVMNHVDYNGILPPHLFNTEYSVDKCDELLEIGFFAKVGNLDSDEINSTEEQESMYNSCVEIALTIEKKNQ